MNKKRILFVLLTFLLLAVIVLVYRTMFHVRQSVSAADRAAIHIMPLPAQVKLTDNKLMLPARFRIKIRCSDPDQRIERAVDRFRKKMQMMSPSSDGDLPVIPLKITCERNNNDSLLSVEKENYDLKITGSRMHLRGGGQEGVLHGLETILQLVDLRDDRVYLPSVKISDRPRYPWRGLMIDVCRHWIPKDVVLRNLEAMAAVKLNVLHLHLTDYQAFRIESKVFPQLHQKGSDGHYFSQEDIGEIIRYAADRGIRVVPEFDLPGHSTSWFAGYPELATEPGKYVADTVYGILNPVMDPTREEVYNFLDRFFGEMAGLFPDPYIHIGGDEVNPKQWEESAHVRHFMGSHGIMNVHELQNYFNIRLEQLLANHGKKMMGWDEILNPALPKDIVVQSWRNQKSLFEAVRRGGLAVLSAGYYLDHKLPAGKHYSVDPEIIPGAVDIEPDTLHWKTWDIALDVSGQSIEGSLTLYGEDGDLRGFVGLMGGNTGFTDARLEDETLQFDLPSDYGTISFRLRMSGDSISGKANLGILGIKVSGILKGSSQLSGTHPPVIERIKPLTSGEKMRILGGEACMWSEVVNEVNIESRIWPRTAAIAEKLWSPQSLTKDTEDMYRRLKTEDSLLTRFGLKHHSHYMKQLEDLAAGGQVDLLKSFVDLLEEVKYYERMSFEPNLSVSTPLNRVVDAAWPESMKARDFNKLVETFVSNPDTVTLGMLRAYLEPWSAMGGEIAPIAARSEAVGEVVPLADMLSEMSALTLEMLSDYADTGVTDAMVTRLDILAEKASRPIAGVLLAVDPGFRELAKFFRNQE